VRKLVFQQAAISLDGYICEELDAIVPVPDTGGELQIMLDASRAEPTW
jgi:hypothetical protein